MPKQSITVREAHEVLHDVCDAHDFREGGEYFRPCFTARVNDYEYRCTISYQNELFSQVFLHIKGDIPNLYAKIDAWIFKIIWCEVDIWPGSTHAYVVERFP